MTLDALEQELDVSADTWRRLQGQKRGTTWTIEPADALNYLESRSPWGRPPAKRKTRGVR